MFSPADFGPADFGPCTLQAARKALALLRFSLPSARTLKGSCAAPAPPNTAFLSPPSALTVARLSVSYEASVMVT